MHRYCRGVDRFDREMVLSVYHPDAIDDHGVFVGRPEAFVDWAFAYHARHQQATHHIVTNHTCELDGDTAHTETYWIFSGINKQASAQHSLRPLHRSLRASQRTLGHRHARVRE